MELPIVSASAMVLQYDSSSAQWKELGSESGLCMLSILKSSTNEYRYVAQKISNNELVLNAYIFPEMKYDETTATFHQWYDKSKNAYGLNFSDQNMAKKFAAAMACALEQLVTPSLQHKSAPVERPTVPPGGGGSTRKTTDSSSSRGSSKVSPYATTAVGNTTASQNNSTSASKTSPVKPSAGAPPPPGPPPSAPAPPGPPPPGPSVAKPSSAPGNDFASQLKKAAAEHKAVDMDSQLNKSTPSETRPSVNVTPPAPTAGGGMDFLTEMRMKMNKKAAGGAPPGENASVPKGTFPGKPVSTSSTISSNLPSVSTVTKPLPVDSESLPSKYVTTADLEKFRSDLMNDILSNMERIKEEIIAGISSRLN